MTYAFMLAFHISNALVTGLVVLYTLYAAVRNRESQYRTLALMLGFVAALQVATGTMLAILSPELSALSLLFHIVAYLGACAAVELFLFAKMQKVSLVFPLKLATAPVLMSVAFFAAAISYGF